MGENPYEAPREVKAQKLALKDGRWHPFTWGVIGFFLGTLVVAPFSLCRDRIPCLETGAIFGGIPVGLYFLMSAVERRRNGH